MASSPAAAVLRAVRSAMAVGAAEESDRELLRRFAGSDDQAAFAALVRRHGGMVLGVCRRALPTVQDAEDACQATFLVLVRKAKTDSWRDSVAGWLYTTARNVSRRARLAARRRARREARAAVTESVEAVDRVSGRELLATLDEELGRLPARYREPLVLCYLEGLTRDEAAVRLGVPPATVKTRLERGRKRLATALSRRGCAVGVGLLALAATSPAGASPPRLVEGVLAAVRGSSPAAAALAKGVAVQQLQKKSLIAALALLGAGVLGLGAWSRMPAAAGPPLSSAHREKPEKAEKPNPPKPNLTLTGRVVGPDGKPVAGAALLFLGQGGLPADLGTSGLDGRFRVEVPAQKQRAFLIARTDGSGIDFVDVARIDPSRPVELRTVADRPVRGRVVNTQGKPVPGARVAVQHVGVYAGDSLDPFLAEWMKRPFESGMPAGTRSLSLPSGTDDRWRGAGAFFAATTGADGRFTIAGVGAERLVALSVRGAGIARTEVWVVNRDGFDPRPYNEATVGKIPTGVDRSFGFNPLLFGPDPSVVLEGEKPVRGVVRELDTGRGLAGVRVSMEYFDGSRSYPLTATTGAGGRFEIRGARKAVTYTFQVGSDPAAGLLGRHVTVPDTDGYRPVTADIALARGVVVTGRVVAAATGKGIPGFATVGVLFDNPFFRSRPEYAEADQTEFQPTAVDGTFRVVTIPGPVLLMGGPTGRAAGSDLPALARYKRVDFDPKYPQYFTRPSDAADPSRAYFAPDGGMAMIQGNFCKVLKLEPGAAPVRQDVVLEPASTLEVHVQDAAGRPVRRTLAAGLAAGNWTSPFGVAGDSCTAYGVEPGRPRLLVFYEPVRKLAGTRGLKGDEKGPVVVTLRAAGAVKGRLADSVGRPLAGVVVEVGYEEPRVDEVHACAHRFKRVVTDASGAFAVDELIPGASFHLYRPIPKRPGDRSRPLLGRALTVESGRTLQLGVLTLRADRGDAGP
jgi:RNA polymerase sigma factor (sigma-70 family)